MSDKFMQDYKKLERSQLFEIFKKFEEDRRQMQEEIKNGYVIPNQDIAKA